MSYVKVFVQPHFHQRILIIGAGWPGQTLAQAIAETGDGDGNPYRGTGYRVLGFVDDDPAKQGQEIAGIPVLGGRRDLVRLAQELRPDAVILALPHGQAIHDELLHAIFDCRELGIELTAMASLYERMTGRVPVEYVGPHPNVIMSELQPRSRRLYLLVKHLFDIAVALIGCTLIAILSPLIWLANHRTAPGDLFYRQKCRGAGGQCFQMIKFRSMAVNAGQSTGGVWANENGSRVTPMGRILRKTRLDEIPQFWNVLRGEMSLIGPRPVVLSQLTQEIPFYRVRYAVKPGITGWAQVHYDDGAAPHDALVELQYDLYYIKHQGLYLDLLILLKTVQVMWKNRCSGR